MEVVKLARWLVELCGLKSLLPATETQQNMAG